MKTVELLKELGFSQQQADVFVLVYQYGPKPASTIAKMMGVERTNMYKMLKVLVNKGLVAQTTKLGTQQFFVPDTDILHHLIQEKKEELKKLESGLMLANSELEQLQGMRVSALPEMSFFEGKSGMQNFFEDLESYVEEHQYMVVKFFASNTLESQSHAPSQLSDYAKKIFSDMQKKGVRMEAYLGNGIIMLEQVLKTYDIEMFDQLPAGSSAVQIFVVGEAVWIALFNQIPFGIKILNRAFADVIHFFFKQMGEE